MSDKPRNKWISYGLTAFIGFLLVFVVGFFTFDIRLTSIGESILWGLSLLLQAGSLIFSVYGLFTINREKESGVTEAVVISVLMGVFEVIQIYHLIT